MPGALPAGLLLSWYGDDFTGSAAVMEVLAFSGIESVLFLGVPTPEQLQQFPGARAIGIAGIARSQTPEWMDAELPRIFASLATLGAPIAHYKICSTFDSSPEIGSIGHAVDLAVPLLGGRWHPMIVAAPAMGRYQAFGNLFAAAGGNVHRLDRHPSMARHPVTPMDEADLRLHLAKQTKRPIRSIELHDLRIDGGRAALASAIERNDSPVVAIDGVDASDLVSAGRLMVETHEPRLLAVGSQGVEYALVAYWQSLGLLPKGSTVPGAARHERVAVVSGSVSPTTAAQITWAEENGFSTVPFDAAAVVDDRKLADAIDNAVSSARAVLERGASPIVATARGPDDPAVARYRHAVDAAGLDAAEANARVGRSLGHILVQLRDHTGIERAIIAGGDTSGHAGLELGVFALTALAPTIPGAALLKAHCHNGKHLELALKGGQMGSIDYFGWIRDGGGERLR